MSKKDYQAIARQLNAAHEIISKTSPAIKNLTPQELAHWTVGYITSRLADTLAADNPRFDRARFIEACETGKCKGMRG